MKRMRFNTTGKQTWSSNVSVNNFLTHAGSVQWCQEVPLLHASMKNVRSKKGCHWKVYSLKSNRGLLRSHMQLCCRSWRIISVTNMNRHPTPEVFCGVHIRTLDGQSMISMSWFSSKSVVALALWGGALSWTKTKLFWMVLALVHRKRLCCSTRLYSCWFIVPPRTTS